VDTAVVSKCTRLIELVGETIARVEIAGIELLFV
jgi:hypothetical protein